MIRDIDLFGVDVLATAAGYSHNALPAMVSDVGITADSKGRKIVPAGTVVGGEAGSWMGDPKQYVAKKNDASAEGVLRFAVDVTGGPKAGTVLIEGIVSLDKMPEAPDAAAKTALPNIQWRKY